MVEENPFLKMDQEDLDRAARQNGFKRKGQRNWVRRTADFVQLVNLQKSQWSPENHYLNFALWPLALGEPPTIAESKFKFRTRGEALGAHDIASFFAAADELMTLDGLRDAQRAGRITGLFHKDLRDLLT